MKDAGAPRWLTFPAAVTPPFYRRLLRSLLVSVIAALCATDVARAEFQSGDGSKTGDGSTPFTGLAQAPEANLFVGAATTSVPIEVAPGRKNLTPKLALSYNSSAGPSPYGYGWELPLGKIQRSTKHGVLSCTDTTYHNDFVLVLPGAGVECTLDPATNRCHVRIEESFLRIEYVPGQNYWVVWDKSGLRYTFGLNPQERTGNAFALFDSGQGASDCSYTFSWALSAIQDPNGNLLEFAYLSGTDGLNIDGVVYPDKILYGGHADAQGALDFAHQFEVNFVWSDEDGFGRPAGDQIINSMGGFAARLTKLLSRVEVRYPVRRRARTLVPAPVRVSAH